MKKYVLHIFVCIIFVLQLCQWYLIVDNSLKLAFFNDHFSGAVKNVIKDAIQNGI